MYRFITSSWSISVGRYGGSSTPVTVGDAGGEVGAPVTLSVVGPLECGVDMDIGQLGQDWRGQFGGECDEGCGPGRSDLDPVARELVAERLAAEGLAGPHAREQPWSQVGQAAGESGAPARRLGESVNEFGQAGRYPQREFPSWRSMLSEAPWIWSVVR